jgi:hypothetical protein
MVARVCEYEAWFFKGCKGKTNLCLHLVRSFLFRKKQQRFLNS